MAAKTGPLSKKAAEVDWGLGGMAEALSLIISLAVTELSRGKKGHFIPVSLCLGPLSLPFPLFLSPFSLGP